ncbi:CCA tRNA nucleotidyltransferase [Fictibacillus nanhaiensis]|uniref:CCA tRNA nucleotidyltransferase n=1 Tax=Fictibacillus nanhaiensis TaxID=742169 RepID=UPI001C979C94|nr:CCA tRNA nucleotidyltransferase [Fictibacillus nanhaiensis]MBY6035718.1 CCA tRNA nucleotidyltransferase [Fictibacillus nanhaiensis]
MNELFQEASYVIEQIEKEGYKAYYVGGCVRDYCLKKPIKDIDIASNAKPEDIQRIFPKTIPVGIEHGTVIVRHNHVSYEVTTFRKEDQYKDYRRPSQVWFVDELEEDLSRRDFTFNAMAMDKSYKLIDPFHGRMDLKKQEIRTVGDPDHRFSEDPLRLMRACRFMSVYNMDIEERTRAAIGNHAPLLKKISTERITAEFRKLLEGEQAGKALEFMQSSHVAHYLPHPIKEQKNGNMLTFDWCSLKHEEQRWAAVIILSKVNDRRDFLKKWKIPNPLSKAVLDVVEATYTDSWSKMKLYETSLKTALLGLQIRCLLNGAPYHEKAERLKQTASEIPISSRSDIPLRGEDILSIKKEVPGEWVGQLFQEMEKEIVEGELPLSESELIEWVRRWERL